MEGTTTGAPAYRGHGRYLGARRLLLLLALTVAEFPFVGHAEAPNGVGSQDLYDWFTADKSGLTLQRWMAHEQRAGFESPTTWMPAQTGDSATARTVILAHGFARDPKANQYLADLLAQQGLNVLSLRLPGHGRSVKENLRPVPESAAPNDPLAYVRQLIMARHVLANSSELRGPVVLVGISTSATASMALVNEDAYNAAVAQSPKEFQELVKGFSEIAVDQDGAILDGLFMQPARPARRLKANIFAYSPVWARKLLLKWLGGEVKTDGPHAGMMEAESAAVPWLARWMRRHASGTVREGARVVEVHALNDPIAHPSATRKFFQRYKGAIVQQAFDDSSLDGEHHDLVRGLDGDDPGRGPLLKNPAVAAQTALALASFLNGETEHLQHELLTKPQQQRRAQRACRPLPPAGGRRASARSTGASLFFGRIAPQRGTLGSRQ